MNFIIAVVGSSYENCMQTYVAQSFKVKLDMIIERESIMSESEFNNEKWFPKFILMRRPKDAGSGTDEAEIDSKTIGKEIMLISERSRVMQKDFKTDLTS